MFKNWFSLQLETSPLDATKDFHHILKKIGKLVDLKLKSLYYIGLRLDFVEWWDFTVQSGNITLHFLFVIGLLLIQERKLKTCVPAATATTLYIKSYSISLYVLYSHIICQSISDTISLPCLLYALDSLLTEAVPIKTMSSFYNKLSWNTVHGRTLLQSHAWKPVSIDFCLTPLHLSALSDLN